MTVKERIFNNLSKVELSVHRVELKIIGSIEKELDKIYNDIDRSEGILNKAGNDVESISKNVLLKIEYSKDRIKEAEKMSKEIGVEVPELSNLNNRLLKAEQKGNSLMKRSKSVQ